MDLASIASFPAPSKGGLAVPFLSHRAAVEFDLSGGVMIEGRFAEAIEFHVCLVAHNLPADLHWRLQLFGDDAFMVVAWDSDWIREPSGYGGGMVRLLLDGGLECSAWRLGFEAQADATLVLDRVYFGVIEWWPETNFDVGINLSWVDPSPILESPGRAPLAQNRIPYRELTVQFSQIGESDRFFFSYFIAQKFGRRRDLFVEAFPDAGPDLDADHRFLGRLASHSVISSGIQTNNDGDDVERFAINLSLIESAPLGEHRASGLPWTPPPGGGGDPSNWGEGVPGGGGGGYPIFSIEPLDADKVADGSEFTFRVRRGFDIDPACSVDYVVEPYFYLGHSAVESDFSGAAWPTGTIGFEERETALVIFIPVLENYEYGPDKGFLVRLLNPSAGKIGISRAVGVIRAFDYGEY